MNYFFQQAVSGGTGIGKGGLIPQRKFQFVRLNYIQATAGYASPYPNMLVIRIGAIWKKLHEGETCDFGEVAVRDLQFDLFPSQYGPGVGGGYDLELEFAENPLQNRWSGSERLFADGAAVTLTTLQTINPGIALPPNFTAAPVQGLTPLPVMRRLRINNQSGGDLTIVQPGGSGVSSRITTATIFDEPLRGLVYIKNATGGSLTFDYTVFFEWI